MEADEGIEVSSQHAVIYEARLEKQMGSSVAEEPRVSEISETLVAEENILSIFIISGNPPSLSTDKDVIYTEVEGNLSELNKEGSTILEGELVFMECLV